MFVKLAEEVQPGNGGTVMSLGWRGGAPEATGEGGPELEPVVFVLCLCHSTPSCYSGFGDGRGSMTEGAQVRTATFVKVSLTSRALLGFEAI